jgi:hypothetical protein
MKTQHISTAILALSTIRLALLAYFNGPNKFIRNEKLYKFYAFFYVNLAFAVFNVNPALISGAHAFYTWVMLWGTMARYRSLVRPNIRRALLDAAFIGCVGVVAKEYYPVKYGYFVPGDYLDFFLGYVLPYMIDPGFAVPRFIGGPLLSMAVSYKTKWEFSHVLRICQCAFALLIE